MVQLFMFSRLKNVLRPVLVFQFYTAFQGERHMRIKASQRGTCAFVLW
jgi:hypothetical protein